MFSLVVLAFFASSAASFSPISQHLPAATTIRRRGEQPTTSSSFYTTTSLSMAALLTLYGSPGSRSPLVNWAAYELNVPLVAGDLSKNPHPFGQIPCLADDDDGGVVVFESGAILNYLQSKADNNKVLHGDARTAAITSWIAWANASLDPICFLEREGRV
jgi:glutathione S-transferase